MYQFQCSHSPPSPPSPVPAVSAPCDAARETRRKLDLLELLLLRRWHCDFVVLPACPAALQVRPIGAQTLDTRVAAACCSYPLISKHPDRPPLTPVQLAIEAVRATDLDELEVDEGGGAEDGNDELDGVGCPQLGEANEGWSERGEGRGGGGEDHGEADQTLRGVGGRNARCVSGRGRDGEEGGRGK